MSALPYPKYGIENLYLFRYYQTREAYQQATGEDTPPWDSRRAPKHWRDIVALQSARRNVVYDAVLLSAENGRPLAGADGKPVLDLLVLSKTEAASVNIPPAGPGISNVPGAEVAAVPCPLRPLEPNEELFFDFGGVVAVKNLDLYPKIEVGFTAADRDLLRAIARRLGAME